jgi:hypothetical protein
MKQFGRILKWSAVGLCVGFIVIQFVPVNRTNPHVESDLRAPAEVLSVLRRACYDCHSNQTGVAMVFADRAGFLGDCP